VLDKLRAVGNQAAIPGPIREIVAFRQAGACRKGNHVGQALTDRRIGRCQKPVRSNAADPGKCVRNCCESVGSPNKANHRTPMRGDFDGDRPRLSHNQPKKNARIAGRFSSCAVDGQGRTRPRNANAPRLPTNTSMAATSAGEFTGIGELMIASACTAVRGQRPLLPRHT
jgi:hypothetical protein